MLPHWLPISNGVNTAGSYFQAKACGRASITEHYLLLDSRGLAHMHCAVCSVLTTHVLIVRRHLSATHAWTSVSPACNSYCYRRRLRADVRQLTLTMIWSIQGPDEETISGGVIKEVHQRYCALIECGRKEFSPFPSLQAWGV